MATVDSHTLTNRADEQATTAEKVRNRIGHPSGHAFPCDKLVKVSGFDDPLPCSLGFGHVSQCRVDQGTVFAAVVAECALLRAANGVNRETIAAQQAEIRRLESIPVMNPEWRTAVLRFFEERREDICTLWHNQSATVHSIAERNASEFSAVVDRALNGDLDRLWLLCGFCRDERCGGPELCKEAAKDVLSPEERFEMQIPTYLHDALQKLRATNGQESE